MTYFFLIETKPRYSESIQVLQQQRIFRSGLGLWYIRSDLTQTSEFEQWDRSILLGTFAKLWKATICFIVCVCLSIHPTVRKEQFACRGRIFKKFYILIFLKNCQENSSFIKIWQEKQVLYLKTSRYFWSYIAHFFLEWEMFQTEVVKEIKTHFVFNTFFRKSSILWNNVEKYCGSGQATDDNVARAHYLLTYLLTQLLHGAESFLRK